MRTLRGAPAGPQASPQNRIGRAGEPQVAPASDGSLTVTVPIRIKHRGSRKTLTLPGGAGGAARRWDHRPTPLHLALARGHRWLALLESGDVRSLRALAAREGVDKQRRQPDGEPHHPGAGHYRRHSRREPPARGGAG